jgi:hypothetical protein
VSLFTRPPPQPIYGLQTVSDNNKTLSVTVSPNDDIQKVKKTIQEQEAIPMDQQRFIFEGKPVPDNASLSKIGEGSLLHLEREVQAETPAEGKQAEHPLSRRHDPVYSAELGQNYLRTVPSTQIH